MFSITNINPDILVIIAALIAIFVSQNLSQDEINVLANFISEIGASLSTKAAQAESLQTKEDLKKQIADMEQQLAKLKQQLCK